MKQRFFLITAFITIVIVVIVSCDQKENKSTANQPPSDDSLIKRGGYLVSVCGCDDCHTPKKFGANGPESDMDRRLSGYRSEVHLPPIDTNVIKSGWYLANAELTGWAGPWGASFTANLTSDETGIG